MVYIHPPQIFASAGRKSLYCAHEMLRDRKQSLTGMNGIDVENRTFTHRQVEAIR